MNKTQTHNEFKNKTNKDTKTNTIKNTISTQQTSPEAIKKNEKSTHQQKANKTPPTKRRASLGALFFFCPTLVVAIASTLLGGNLNENYQKPPAYAPDWLFPIAWIIFYIAIALASFFVYLKTKDKNKRTCDGIWYGIHLLFNLLWPLFFFRLNSLILSPICLILMIIPSLVLTYKYYKTYLPSGVIFTIYTLWLFYALYLNLGITMLNTPLNL